MNGQDVPRFQPLQLLEAVLASITTQEAVVSFGDPPTRKFTAGMLGGGSPPNTRIQTSLNYRIFVLSHSNPHQILFLKICRNQEKPPRQKKIPQKHQREKNPRSPFSFLSRATVDSILPTGKRPLGIKPDRKLGERNPFCTDSLGFVPLSFVLKV